MALSFIEYTGNGAQTDFTITFPYINEADVTVLVNGVSVSFTFFSATVARCAVAPANGATVRVRRTTEDEERLVDFTEGGPFSARVLDLDSDQMFYLLQEAQDNFEEGTVSDGAIGTVKLADDAVTPDKIAPGAVIAEIGAGDITAAMLGTMATRSMRGRSTAGTGVQEVVAWDDMTVIADGSVTARDLSARYGEKYNVKDYGAAGDGAADDTAEIQLAIDAAEAAGGGVVYFPRGTYRHTGVSVEGDYITLLGDGPSSVLECTHATNSWITLVGNRDHCEIRRLRLQEQAAVTNTAGWAVEIAGGGTLWPVIADCVIIHAFGGIGMTQTTGDDVQNLVISNVIMRDTKMTGINLQRCLDPIATNVLIDMVDFRVDSAGVRINGNTQAVHYSHIFVIRGYRCLHVEDTLTLSAPNDLNFHRCVFDNGGLQCVFLEDLRRGRMTNCSVSTQQVNAYGVYVGTNCVDMQIANNEIFNIPDRPGIYVTSAARETMIQGNRIFSNDQHGILVQSTAQKFWIQNNRSYNNPDFTAGSQDNAIEIGSSCEDYVLTGNICIGNNTQGIRDDSTATNSHTADNYGALGSVVLRGQTIVDHASIADGAGITSTITVTGAALGMHATVSCSVDLAGITLTAWVSSANTVSYRLQNESGGAVNLANANFFARVTPHSI